MKVALFGYGRMGRAVETVCGERGHEIVLRLRSEDNPDGEGITPASMEGVEVAIDFSHPDAVLPNVTRASGLGVDLVVGTTGWYDRLEAVRDTVEAAGTGLLYAPNFSLGVQLLFRLVRRAAGLVDRLGDYDPAVLEVHHRHKVDHPSGTALRLAEILLEEVGRKERWEEGPGEGPAHEEILQVAVVRTGENPGTHVVSLEGPEDRLEIRHEARGRGGFARGAVEAAEWVAGREGVFTIDDLLAELGLDESREG